MKQILIISALLIVGCASKPTTWDAEYGSRADGTVKLVYDHAWHQSPEITLTQGQTLAQAKCEKWGYKNAEAFGPATSACVDSKFTMCTKTRVTANFQCY